MSTLNHIRDFLRIDDRLATSGRPQPGDFAALRQAGFNVVINLALPTSDHALPNEGELVSAQGMTCVHIPVKFDAPQPADFELFTRVLTLAQASVCSCIAPRTCASRGSAFCTACVTGRIGTRLKMISRKSGSLTACGGSF